VEGFLDVLQSHGMNVQVRKRKGSRIDAACGQLRRLAAGSPVPPKAAEALQSFT